MRKRSAKSKLIIGITTAAALGVPLTGVPQALAGIQSDTAATHIYMNGINVSNPQHVVAKDPWGTSVTAWVPLYYLQDAFAKNGAKVSWNGKDLSFPAPPGVAEPLNIPMPKQLKAGEMDFLINQRQDLIAPKLIAKDPSSGVSTTYVPIYYINLFLEQDYQMQATWDGSNWSLINTSKLVPDTEVSKVMTAVTESDDSSEHFGDPGQQVMVADGSTGTSGTLSAVVGTRVPTADGHGQLVFFFHNGRFVGLASDLEATEILSVKPDGTGRFAVTYANYKASDPMIDPTLPPQTVTYTWDGSKFVSSENLAAGTTSDTQVTVPAGLS